MKIRITNCQGYGPAFEKMTPGSEHEVLRIDQDEKRGLRGFYVEADGGDVLIWATECNLVEEGGAE